MDFESATVSASPDTRATPDLGQVPQAIHWGWLYSVWSHSTMELGTGDWVYYAWIIDEGPAPPVCKFARSDPDNTAGSVQICTLPSARLRHNASIIMIALT